MIAHTNHNTDRASAPYPQEGRANFPTWRFAAFAILRTIASLAAAVTFALAPAACEAPIQSGADGGSLRGARPAQDRLDRVAARVMEAANGFCGVETRYAGPSAEGLPARSVSVEAGYGPQAGASGGWPAVGGTGASAEVGLVPSLETVRAEPGNKSIAPRCRYPIEMSDRALVYASTNGSRIRITQGMLAFASNDSELAFVLSHELAHDLLGHARAFHGGNRARMELEADYVGIYITARAGYDVETASRFMLRLAAAYPEMEGDSSYPASAARYAMLERAAREIALKTSSKAPLVPNFQTLEPADDARSVARGGR